MAFFKDNGVYYYKVMPFGLKNAGTTYQRLVNSMFVEQLGRNVEAYVDDMIVKSPFLSSHCVDLQETFDTLQRYQMKLNPKKCAFGEHLHTLSTLAKLRQGETLFAYLGVSNTVVRSVLVLEGGREQQLVYYVSMVLFPGKNYMAIEKWGFALVPLKQVFKKYDAFGRMVKWTMELSQFDIDYALTAAFKDQALADFINEDIGGGAEPLEVGQPTNQPWILMIDKSSIARAVGVSCVLVLPEGGLLKYALVLTFPATNNEAECEALITGLMIARGARWKFLIVAVDLYLKWVEAEPLATIIEKAVIKLFRANIACRFRAPHILIFNNGTQFKGKEFKDFCELHIEQRFVSMFKTIPQTAMEETPFSLVYGSEAVLPAEIDLYLHRIVFFKEELNEQLHREELDTVDERLLEVAESMAHARQAASRHYTRRLSFKSKALHYERVVCQRGRDPRDMITPLKHRASWEEYLGVDPLCVRGARNPEESTGPSRRSTWGEQFLSVRRVAP
ncbi:hypothetical protein CRG98_033307 [Punica granatum]|uniref:Reverse transcriptase domain-containing protein n=1 Tax=Punica granatum TaxID=22663 RepID=A0A2I0IQM6_PUNGR|nr:hypothetical protein CRG98_033307 [Punica granatum]